MDEVYISQWDALNCFEDWEDAHGNLYYAYEDRTYQAIEKLPPADVRPVVRGEWNLIEHPLEKAAICECSECKNRIWKYDGDDGWNFCPNCGADMRPIKEDGNV